MSTNQLAWPSHDHLRTGCLACFFCCVCLAGFGCGTDDGQQPVGGETAVTEGYSGESNIAKQAIEDTSTSVDSRRRDTTVGPAVTRQELQLQIQRHKSNGQWHFGERVAGELAGTWRTVEGRGHPVVFGADGSYSEDFNGKMTEGLYAISDTGKIIAFSKWKGVGLSARYRLEGGMLIGPNGPTPNERWMRIETGE